jgi:glycerophosphoryl diester phosphodiesterase
VNRVARPTFTWLTARPIAHRGLHAFEKGVIENSISAAMAAVDSGYAIECDVRLSLDGELVVFHDFALDRLTIGEGRLDALTADELSRLSLARTSDRIPLFTEFLDAIAGRTPLIVSIKSNFDGDLRVARRTAEIAATYAGPLALKSFDPDIVAYLREEQRSLGIAHIPLGVVAESSYESPQWSMLSAQARSVLTNFLHYPRTRPDFLSWSASALPHPTPFLCRQAVGLPVMVWTVRSQDVADSVAPWVDQILFEGFTPSAKI